MNKPAYAAIRAHSPRKPSLIFVSSRRQTRLTALDLISFCVADDAVRLLGECASKSIFSNPSFSPLQAKQWVHMDEDSLEQVLSTVRDPHLRHSLNFGIGMHHAGLHEQDRKVGKWGKVRRECTS